MYVHSIDESDRCMCPIPPVPASFCGLRGTAWYLLAVCASGPSHMQYMQPSWDCYHPNSLWPSWGPLFAGALHCQSQTTCLCPSVASCGLVWLIVRKALGDVSGWWRVQRQDLETPLNNAKDLLNYLLELCVMEVKQFFMILRSPHIA